MGDLDKRDSRQRAIERMQRRLLHNSSPRIEMVIIVSLAGAAGFFSSIGLLHLGLTRMLIRYPLSVILGYCVFLLLLRIWISIKVRSLRDDGVAVDASNLAGTIGDLAVRGRGAPVRFGGGSSGGGGASDSWAAASIGETSARSGMFGGSRGGGGGSASDIDLEDLGLVILAILAALGAIAAAVYVVYGAPALFAEILLDSVLMAGLYKRLKGVEPRFWMMSVFRRTWVPAVVIIVLCSLAGYFLQKAAPDARTIGEVVTQVMR